MIRNKTVGRGFKKRNIQTARPQAANNRTLNVNLKDKEISKETKLTVDDVQHPDYVKNQKQFRYNH